MADQAGLSSHGVIKVKEKLPYSPHAKEPERYLVEFKQGFEQGRYWAY